MPEIVLFQFAPVAGVDSGSPFCTKVHRCLSYKGLSYSVKEVSNPAEMKRLNPACRKVPVLSYDKTLVCDSSRILAFIEKRHPQPPLYPAEPRPLAQVQLWEDWADESLYWFAVYTRWADDESFRALAAKFFGHLPSPLRWIVQRIVRRSVRRQLHGQGLGRLDLEQVLEQLGSHLSMLDTFLTDSDFLVGERLTAADISAFGPLQAICSPITRRAREVVHSHRPVMDWLRRVDQAARGEHTVPLGED